jgi:hypothetical protein
MAGNLPVIVDQERANRVAIERCPTGAIVWVDDDGRQQRGRDAVVIAREGVRRAAVT